MESKINYHSLSMDEIVFDNRNKRYGAFAVRKTYEKNLLKAILISAGFFILSMCSPTILKNLGLLAQKKITEFTQTIITPDNFPVLITKLDKKTPTSRPASPKSPARTVNTYQAVKPDEADPKQPAKPTEDPSGQTANPGPNGNSLLPSGNGLDSNATPPAKPSKDIYVGGRVEEMPSFIGGEEALTVFIEKNLIYKEEDDIEGTADIQFVVNADGSIEQVKVSRSSGYKSLDAAALKLVKSMPKFNPGRQNGQAVRVLCVIPIGFEIN